MYTCYAYLCILIPCLLCPQCVTISEEDQFLLLACDGLFDVYTPEEIVTFVKGAMEKHGDTQRCCQVRCTVVYSVWCMSGVLYTVFHHIV
ncbi:hypothetical protein EON64_13070 [archaeon]|nr:MAG: hypothetical protein EON64_13070 [archaeon]